MIDNDKIYIISTIEGMKIIWFETPLKNIKDLQLRRQVLKLRQAVGTYEDLTGRKVDKDTLLLQIWLNDFKSQKEYNNLK